MVNRPSLSDLVGMKEIPQGAVKVITDNGIFPLISASTDILHVLVNDEDQKLISVHTVNIIILCEGWAYNDVDNTLTLSEQDILDYYLQEIDKHVAKICSLGAKLGVFSANEGTELKKPVIEKPYVCRAVGDFGVEEEAFVTFKEAKRKLERYVDNAYHSNVPFNGVCTYEICTDGKNRLISSVIKKQYDKRILLMSFG